MVQNFNNQAGEKKVYVDSSSRKSETAWLRDGDPVVDCVKSRAATFQGFAPNATMEQLAVLKVSLVDKLSENLQRREREKTLCTHTLTVLSRWLIRDSLRLALRHAPANRPHHQLLRDAGGIRRHRGRFDVVPNGPPAGVEGQGAMVQVARLLIPERTCRAPDPRERGVLGQLQEGWVRAPGDGAWRAAGVKGVEDWAEHLDAREGEWWQRSKVDRPTGSVPE